MIDRLNAIAVPFFGCAFFGVLFLQSGMDKVLDRKGNLAWMGPHFEKSPFKGQVPLLLSMLTVMELASGLGCLVGAVLLFADFHPDFAKYGLWLATLTLISLFAGQRLAKDYAGAGVLAAYFAAALLALSSAH